MTLHVELTPEHEYLLKREAERRSMTVEQYTRWLLEASLPPANAGTGKLTAADVAELTKELRQGSEKLPVLPDEAITREGIYGIHP